MLENIVGGFHTSRLFEYILGIITMSWQSRSKPTITTWGMSKLSLALLTSTCVLVGGLTHSLRLIVGEDEVIANIC